MASSLRKLTIQSAVLFILACAAAVLFSACHSPLPINYEPISPSAGRVVNHANGESVIPLDPQRVVIMGSVIDAVALGVEPVGATLTGIPQRANVNQLSPMMHDKTDDIAVLGHSNQPNLESMVALAPDLILATQKAGNLYRRLAQIAPTVVIDASKGASEWKTYVLNFSKTVSLFNEEEKLDAISGATDSWGANFARGEQYKNVKEKSLVQNQEFYGKQFLVKDELQKFDWKIGKESKQIGQYLCFKATTAVPSTELAWFNFSWGDLRNQQPKEDGTLPDVRMTTIEAWYTPQIPVSHGPAEYWGLPGLILEVNTDDTTMLCTKIVLNPKGKINLEAPSKGKEITKIAYRETITEKMKEMRDNRGRRSGR